MRRLTGFALVVSLCSPAAALPELTLGPVARRADQRFTVDRVIAVVGGIPVFSSELAMRVRGTASALRAKPPKARRRLLGKATREAYQSLIEQALIEAAGERAGERVSDEEVQSAIARWAPKYWSARDQAMAWGMSSSEYDRAIRIALLEQRLLARYLERHPSDDADTSQNRKRWLAELARTIRIERRLSP